jgi:hypothetical protein
MRIKNILLVLILGGCATPYQELGFTGGVAAQRMTSVSDRRPR